MSKRSSANAANGSTKDSTVGESAEFLLAPRTMPPLSLAPFLSLFVRIQLTIEFPPPAVEKQKKLLHEATGHFTMIRMLHLADLITELNGS
jgi:hypothetical protein